MTDSANEVLKSSVSLKQEIKCMKFIDFHRILYTVIKESLYSYAFHCYIPGLGNEAMLIDNISEVSPYINKAEYWDITKGTNSSEPSNLVAWGGEGGYWSNILNDPETNTRVKELILSKKK